VWHTVLKALLSPQLRPYCPRSLPSLQVVVQTYLSYRGAQHCAGDGVPHLDLVLAEVVEDCWLRLDDWCTLLETTQGHPFGETLLSTMHTHVCTGLFKARYMQGENPRERRRGDQGAARTATGGGSYV
jgi:hypothetical protein